MSDSNAVRIEAMHVCARLMCSICDQRLHPRDTWRCKAHPPVGRRSTSWRHYHVEGDTRDWDRCPASAIYTQIEAEQFGAKTGRPNIEGKALTQLDVHNLVVDRDRARRDLRQEQSRVRELETRIGAMI